MARFKVAVVDDENELLEIYKSALASICEVESFADPDEFIHKIEHSKEKLPDIVITDLTMPKMSGLEMLEKAKSTHKAFFSILISGYLDKEKAIQAANLGAHHIIEKPVSRKALVSKVQEILFEVEARQIRAKIEDVMGKLRELLSLYRTLCEDQTELKGVSSTPLYSPDDLDRPAAGLDESINQLEKELFELTARELEINRRAA